MAELGDDGGCWRGELSSSALAVAVAVIALAEVDRVETALATEKAASGDMQCSSVTGSRGLRLRSLPDLGTGVGHQHRRYRAGQHRQVVAGIARHQDPLRKMALPANVEEVADITRHGHDLFPAVGVQPIHFGLSIEDSLYGGLPLGVARCTPLASGRGRAGPWHGKSVAFVAAVRCRIRVGVRTRSAVIFPG